LSVDRQFTFGAGELAESLHGRSDLEIYRRGLRVCRNFFPTVNGSLFSRPGSMYVAEGKYSATDAAIGGSSRTRVRLIPFVFGNGQSYVLEFGDRYVRFHTNGGTIESSPGVPYEIVSPYPWPALPTVQFAQVGNVMYLTQPAQDAYRLERFTHTSWTLTPVEYVPPAWPGLPYMEPRLDPITFRGFSGYMSEPMIEDSADFTGDASHPLREWIWAITLDGQDKKTGKRFETRPFIITKQYDGADTFPAINGTVADLTDHFVALYADKPVIISAYRFMIGAAPDFIVTGLNLYRGRGADAFGLVGRTLIGKFVDIGDEPNVAIVPPLGTHPFRVLEANGSVLRTEKPIAVAFYGDRLVFGGAHDNDKLIRAATLFISAQGQWDRFDRYKIPVATQALEFDLAVNTRQEVRTVGSFQKLLIGTDAAIHSIWGAGGTPLAADVTPDRRVEASIGCSHLRMLDVKGVPVVAEGYQTDASGTDGFARGLAVHALHFAGGNEGYQNLSLSEQASHLFYGDGGGTERGLVDWAFAARPWQLVWAVRKDGTLLSLTYEPKTRHAGWGRHDTDGLYENVCTVPEGSEDAVYVVVRRTIGGVSRRYIERMTSRSKLGGSQTSTFPFGVSRHADDICVDSAKYYFGAATATLTGLDHLEGKEVWLLREGMSPAGPFVVAGGQIALGAAAVPVNTLAYAGLKYTPEMQTLSVGGEPQKRKNLKGLLLWVKDTRGLRVGPDLVDAQLKPVKQLRPSSGGGGYGVIANRTELLKLETLGSWDEHARAAIRQDLPLPCAIIQLTRIIEEGGNQ
jgi:hypothetical protein